MHAKLPVRISSSKMPPCPVGRSSSRPLPSFLYSPTASSSRTLIDCRSFSNPYSVLTSCYMLSSRASDSRQAPLATSVLTPQTDIPWDACSHTAATTFSAINPTKPKCRLRIHLTWSLTLPMHFILRSGKRFKTS